MKKIGVMGTGTMGSGIIQVCAQNGYDVVIRSSKQEYIDAAVAKIERDGNVINGPSSTVDEQTNLFTITAGGSLNNITNTAANYFNVNGYAYAYINDINVASKFISKANQINVGQ